MRTRYKFSALDTETIHGYAVVLATPVRRWIAHSFEECIKPIFTDRTHGKLSSRTFMFNITFDVQAILKYLPTENLFELHETNETIYNERYKILYIPSKMCVIKDLKWNTNISFYDIAQFYGFLSLDNAAKQYLDDQKINNQVTHDITTQQNNWSVEKMDWYYATHLEEIMDYCQKDAILTQQLAERTSKEIEQEFGIILKSFASKAAIGERLTMNTCKAVKDGKKLVAYPRFFSDAPYSRYAYSAYHGGMFDVWQRGIFGTVTNVDISSAYPYHMLNMPNWSNGDFIEVILDKDLSSDDYYGWVICDFDYTGIPYVATEKQEWVEVIGNKEVIREASGRKIYYPFGMRRQCITLLEYRHLQKWGYEPYLLKGWVWRHNSAKPQYSNPFTWIQMVYDKKSKIKAAGGKKTYAYQLMKIAMNGAYGKTAQTVGAARMQNFFYASYITAATRVQIMDFIHTHHLEDKVILIATDGILLDGKYDFGDLGKGLGSWDVDEYPSALVFGNGIYQLGDGDTRKTRMRGITNDMSFQLKELAEKNKKEVSMIPLTKEKPVTLVMGIKHKNLYTKDDINVFKKRGRKISIETDTTKHWDGIETFGDLLKNKYVGKRFTIQELEDKDLNRKLCDKKQRKLTDFC